MGIFILDKWKKEKKMGKGSTFPNKVDSIRVIFMKIKNMVLAFKFIKMEIYLLGIT